MKAINQHTVGLVGEPRFGICSDEAMSDRRTRESRIEVSAISQHPSV